MSVIEETKIYCNNCGENFFSKFYHGGGIEHNNYTNDYNMNVFVSRFNKGGAQFPKFRMFLDSIMVDDSYRNLKSGRLLHVVMQIFNCRIKWLMKNNHNGIAEYLISMDEHITNIHKYFNNITNEYSDHKAENMWYEFISNYKQAVEEGIGDGFNGI